MKERQFENKTVLITGGATGIGRDTAIMMAKEGAFVAIFDINIPEMNHTVKAIIEFGGKAHAFHVDISDDGAVTEAVRKTEETFGTIDVLINNAGGPANWFGNTQYNIADAPAEAVKVWRKTLEINLLGTMIVTHAAVKNMVMKRCGRIINIGSVAGVNGIAGYADYSASKGGVIALTKALALELAPYSITVNCVSPGSIETHEGSPVTFLGRSGRPDEVAEVIAFLASEKAGFITGQNVIIDGGRCLSMNCKV